MSFYKECINFDDIIFFLLSYLLPDQHPNFQRLCFFAGGHLLIINIMY